jgi:hypothetical protein
MTHHKWWCLMLVLATTSSRVWTADQAALPDPTRPPPGVVRAGVPPGLAASGVLPMAASAPASGASSARARGLPAGPRLTLLRVGGAGNKGVALIDGKAVSVGDRLGEWTVMAIDTRGVTLRGAKGTQRLTLLSATDQGVAVASPAASGSEKESP